jgi:uncharacterized protein (TIGR02594 family)
MTAYELAQRFVGELTELTGNEHHPLIQWFHMLCALGSNQPDETPWCSSFANGVCWLLRLPRSKSAAARSWLNVGLPIDLRAARPGYDVVVLERGAAPAGHVGFFAGQDDTHVFVLGGNQGDAVTVAPFPKAKVLGVRRLKAA